MGGSFLSPSFLSEDFGSVGGGTEGGVSWERAGSLGGGTLGGESCGVLPIGKCEEVAEDWICGLWKGTITAFALGTIFSQSIAELNASGASSLIDLI